LALAGDAQWWRRRTGKTMSWYVQVVVWQLLRLWVGVGAGGPGEREKKRKAREPEKMARCEVAGGEGMGGTRGAIESIESLEGTKEWRP